MKLGILISGRGSNMVALADAVQSGKVSDAEIAVVISDQQGAAGLARAEERGIETLIVERRSRTRAEHEREIVEALQARQVELVCLAGYMRLLSATFLHAYGGRILNIHPSLLPAFPGLDPQRQALEAGVKWSGCTVHFVDATMDGGPIVAQRKVPVHDDDTIETLSARILSEEHKLYPEALAIVLRGQADSAGSNVR